MSELVGYGNTLPHPQGRYFHTQPSALWPRVGYGNTYPRGEVRYFYTYPPLTYRYVPYLVGSAWIGMINQVMGGQCRYEAGILST